MKSTMSLILKQKESDWLITEMGNPNSGWLVDEHSTNRTINFYFRHENLSHYYRMKPI